MTRRFLTKSRFKMAMECPSKLFYTAKKEVYYDSKVDNDFLKALAEGGFQVGELAKRYFPGGIEIESLIYDEALEQTESLLKQEFATIYEGAFRYNDFFIRADIVIKNENSIHLIEVKAKSIDSEKDSFTKKDGGIQGKWRPYLEDVAFQKYVIQNAFPNFRVRASLLLTDKTKKATVDGLNQLFFLYQDGGRLRCRYTGIDEPSALGAQILTLFNVDDELELILSSVDPMPFAELIKMFAEKYKTDEKIAPIIGAQCGKCEFKIQGSAEDTVLKSGFRECWIAAGISPEQLKNPLILDLWSFLGKDIYIKNKIYFLAELSREDLEPKSKKKPNADQFGLSRVDRQELQINKVRNADTTHFLDKEGLRAEMQTWKFPLHFIDFETTAVAIPFNASRRPYEQVAFQFSHHSVLEDGKIEHIGEWISTEIGKFPNYDFVRQLKEQLEADNGTIFRYSYHENSILNAIYRQLKESSEKDREELCTWIQTITSSSSGTADKWEGERKMVDMLELVKRYYYNPLMGGSNSIKKVLPTVLATSEFLKTKYCTPAYGSRIKSLNFSGISWVTYNQGETLINPYDLLPPIHAELENEILDEFLIDEELGIADGGAAMIAFARMQFTEMSEPERQRVKEALLRYCELDTLAMVMIYEAWKDWCK